MNQSAPKFIAKRISVLRSKEDIVITVDQRIARWQESLLMAWLAAWTFCGVVFIYYLFKSSASSDRIFFLISSSLWAYFFVKIVKVFLWRKGGREIIRISAGKLTIINAYWSKGRPQEFHLHNIFKLGLINRDTTSFLSFLDDSFWIIGGDRLGFVYNDQKIQLGKQLDVKDATLLLRSIEGGIREFSKKSKEKAD